MCYEYQTVDQSIQEELLFQEEYEDKIINIFKERFYKYIDTHPIISSAELSIDIKKIKDLNQLNSFLVLNNLLELDPK